jgi:type VI secretion system secreted protein VgrG
MVFEKIVKNIIKREGGIVDHPDDPGSLTNMGISLRSHPDEDIKNLTQERVEEIYYNDYWLPSKADQLPAQIQETFFDMVVNMGQRRAVKILQKTCNSKRGKLVVDGLIGRKTIAASKRIDASRLRVYRILYYTDLIKRKPVLKTFIVGWLRRAMEA